MAHAAARTETMKRTLQCPSSVSQSIMGCFFSEKGGEAGELRWTYRMSLGVRRLDFWY